MEIVNVKKPKSYTKETSEETNDYIIVYNFEHDENTECILSDGTRISSEAAISGARSGKYECRVEKSVEAKTSSYQRDTKNAQYVVLTILLASLAVVAVSKK